MRNNHTSGTNLIAQVPIQPNIGLDSDSCQSVVDILNTLLSDEAVLAMKTRSAHWRIRGSSFLDLKTLFDHQFQQLNGISDEIAERICMLGGGALNSFEEFLNHSRLQEQPGEGPSIVNILADHEAFLRYLREDTRKCFEEYEDQGTFAMLVNVLRTHEKMAWMLRSYIQPELSSSETQLS